ncbi:hypothetical protein LOTGIDRAFT_186849 [Lottia gigantea]|uniref:Ubiquitin thioesterase OTU n=1 Tax=Lottia gigantea TaxID=225164 RepID=V4CC75_LOTGI|nr:hypothetical protein LOTGIDRAFT_186849 [Lottia gigantea]ESO99484.1 hypothetical protein LOTGIDRAFT_186849 [Lottia gigantea]
MCAELKLRCKTNTGHHSITQLTLESTIAELKQKISQIVSLPVNRFQIRHGFPPKILDIDDNSKNLKSFDLRSGDTLIIEPTKSSQQITNQTKPSITDEVLQAQLTSNKTGILTRKVVPANNSCLFTSVNAAMTGGFVDLSCAQQLRQLIAGVVMSDPLTYCEAMLGKSNSDYCKWIMNEESWGGGIEISILSKYYQIEIDVVDTQSGRIDRFGEDGNYAERVLLIYDGIHYDFLILDACVPSIPPQSKFKTSDPTILAQALELGEEAKQRRQFTDVGNFMLRCLVCQKALKGSNEAQEHAKQTSHINFGEY